MNKKLIFGGGAALVAIAATVYFMNQRAPEPEIEFRYAKAEVGTLVRSISATGVVVALTSVDVKSKAGGNVVKLAVDEGDVVRAGQLVAEIDPADTQASYDQANADLQSANARADQAEQNLRLQEEQNRIERQETRNALATAEVRLQRARIEEKRTPLVVTNAVRSAEANVRSAEANLALFDRVEGPQLKQEAASALSQARIALNIANENLNRQQNLLRDGYVAQSAVDQAKNQVASAQNAFENAEQRSRTVEANVVERRRALTLEVDRTKALLEQARANRADSDVSTTNVREAEKAVTTARLAVQRAEANRYQLQVRRQEMLAAKASTVRSQVAVRNARVQLDSTTVVAPRDGVVTKKYLEEGTIIPPGTSTFSEGTSLVQISDVTQMFVDCGVDEADIGSVQKGQRVRIVTEAFPGQFFEGTVERVNPSAETANNVTAVKVRVRILPGFKVKVVPGMNATCEFITLEKKDVLIVPNQAVQTEGGKTTVRVKSADPKVPEVREVQIGESGNEGVEIVSGLKAGDEVVTAEINLAELRATQQKMQEVQQGGGLAGGAPGGGGRRPGGGGGGGGGRPR